MYHGTINNSIQTISYYYYAAKCCNATALRNRFWNGFFSSPKLKFTFPIITPIQHLIFQLQVITLSFSIILSHVLFYHTLLKQITRHARYETQIRNLTTNTYTTLSHTSSNRTWNVLTTFYIVSIFFLFTSGGGGYPNA